MPSKTDINPATGKAYAINPATGQWDDNYFANVVEPKLRAGGGQSGTTGGTLADQLIQASTDTYNKMWNDYKSKSAQFDAANPFNFDQMLEKQTAQVANRLDPYYKQTLTDYLTGVNNTRNRTIEDRQNLLSDLNANTDAYTGQAKIALDKAIESSKSGYADVGLAGSGQQQRATGQLEAGTNVNLADYLRGANVQARNINTTAQRGLTDIGLQSAQKVRDLNAEQQYNTKSQALTATNQAQQQNQFEKAQFTGAPPGATPAQYNTYTTSLLA